MPLTPEKIHDKAMTYLGFFQHTVPGLAHDPERFDRIIQKMGETMSLLIEVRNDER